ncbi:hypothetical protein [Micromonospora sp. NPDC000729]|uniref:hypothetical protein n=1 Tax=Micromonospora sp. NPDC000729 TaxID=3364220 RepID=UPI00369E5D86
MDRATAGPADHLPARPRPHRRGPLRPPEQTQPLYAWAARRPLAVLDDEFGAKDPTTASQRTADGAPTLLHPVDPYDGPHRADIDTVLTWLRRL